MWGSFVFLILSLIFDDGQYLLSILDNVVSSPNQSSNHIIKHPLCTCRKIIKLLPDKFSVFVTHWLVANRFFRFLCLLTINKNIIFIRRNTCTMFHLPPSSKSIKFIKECVDLNLFYRALV